MFSVTVSESNSAPIWKRNPKRVRMGTSLRSGRRSMRWPSNQTSPKSGRSSSTMILSMTLLPVPLAPMTTRHWPALIERFRLLSTTRLPKRLKTCLSSIRAIGSKRV
jgi:hypothetical protein